MEASVRLEEGRIAEARFAGDFQADSAGLLALESALVGCRPVLEEFAPRLNAVYAGAEHTILGADLDAFAGALLEACG